MYVALSLSFSQWTRQKIAVVLISPQLVTQTEVFSILQRIPGCTAEGEEQEIESLEDEDDVALCIAQDLLETVGQDQIVSSTLHLNN